MPDPIQELIAVLHESSCKYAAALSGGGSGLAGRLLSVPGGSKTVVEIVVPYGADALTDYLGIRPASYCSVATSLDLARRACERARRLAPGCAVLGLGCTASLRSDRPKRGDYRCHIAIQSARSIVAWSLTLIKDARSRAEEESVVELLALNALAEGLGVARSISIPLLPGEEIVRETPQGDDLFAAFLAGRIPALRVDADGRIRSAAGCPKLLLPGSFNPLHKAHIDLAYAQTESVFELSVVNADKPPLRDEEIRSRMEQFAWRGPVWLTRAPTFVEKARLFPKAAFVVGVDTAARIVAPRFYGDSDAQRDAALNEIRTLGCRFLVAGRVDTTGVFCGLEQLSIPAQHRDLFVAIPFRCDISSTQLRQQAER